ncbi:MAG: ChaN family lipoprotein [Oligoflexia bacterium]|nr:ChaN family lipoprotein [Oligoflexia bacterium]
MRFKSEIFNLHEKIYESTAKRAQELFGESSKDLQSYFKEQKKISAREFEIATHADIFNKIENSDIIFIADFHTFDRNVYNLEKIILHLNEKQLNFTLALEMVSHNNQKYIDSFLDNHITELEFLELINYNRSWRFPWAHYRKVFELAKTYNFKIIALNSRGSLNDRDNFAAKRICCSLERYSEESSSQVSSSLHKIIVFFGELHILPNKLPLCTQNYIKNTHLEKINITIIHQNIDQVYLKLKSKNIENTIVRFNENEFSIQTSPPWIKYDSVIYWFENFTDDPDFNIHEYIIEKGFKIFGGSTIQNFQLILDEILHSLKLDFFEKDKLSDFDLYDHTNLEYVQTITQTIKHTQLKTFFEYLLSQGLAFKVYDHKKYYSVYYSVNRFAHLAGVHLFTLLIEKINSESSKISDNCSSAIPSLEGRLIEKNRSKRFLVFLQMTMISYFCTKIINPHRKCDMYIDIVNNLKLPNSKLSRRQKKYHIMAISILDNNIDINLLFKDHSLQAYYEVTKIIGKFFSELLFEKMCNIDYEFSVQFIKTIFFTKIIDYDIFIYIKDLLLGDNEYKKTHKREF